MNSKTLFLLFLALAIIMATEARGLHCGKSLAHFIRKVCKAPCEGGVDTDFATFACTNPVSAEDVRERCCPESD